MPKGKGNVIAQNRKASHDYTIVEAIEAGVVLKGTEIKSLRKSSCDMSLDSKEQFSATVVIFTYWFFMCTSALSGCNSC